jgi:hypothetical protein
MGHMGCGIVRSVNTFMGGFLVNAEALLAARHEHISHDDIAPTSARRLPCNDERC